MTSDCMAQCLSTERTASSLSKDDLIDMQGTVVAVHSGGLYRVQVRRRPRSARAAQRPHAALPHQGRAGRPGHRRRLALRSRPRHHHLPRPLATKHLNSQSNRSHRPPAPPAARARPAAPRLRSSQPPRPSHRTAPRRSSRRPATSTPVAVRRRCALDPRLLRRHPRPRLRGDAAGAERGDSARARRPRRRSPAPRPAPARRWRSSSPILQRLLDARRCRAYGDARRATRATSRALILAPTRELAVQIEDEIHRPHLSHAGHQRGGLRRRRDGHRRSARSRPASTSSSPRRAG